MDRSTELTSRVKSKVLSKVIFWSFSIPILCWRQVSATTTPNSRSIPIKLTESSLFLCFWRMASCGSHFVSGWLQRPTSYRCILSDYFLSLSFKYVQWFSRYFANRKTHTQQRWGCLIYSSTEEYGLSDGLCLPKQEPDIICPKVPFDSVALSPYIFQRADN